MNILIRPITVEDAAVSYKWRNDSEVWKFTGSRPSKEITAEIERDWLKKSLGDKSKTRFAILVDGEYVGNVQLTDIILNKTAEFHIFIGEKTMWGKGVAREATYQILTYAKEVLKLRTVFLEVRKEHKAAIKSYEKNGFVTQEIIADSIKMVCTMDHLKPPMVSIFCMVYNQEKYVAQTIEGFLMQKTNFSTVMVIGEDASTDGSKEVILKYATTYPGKFKLLLSDKNFGAHKNQEKVLKHCTGKYIAMCEGDDYWTDSLKLQKQVDFLEANPQLVACHHWQKIAISKGDFFEEIEAPKDGHGYFPYETDVKAIFENKMRVKTRTVMFRNIFDPAEITHNFPKAAFGDVPLSFVLGKYGRFGFIDEEMAVYRQTTTGVSTAGLKELGLKNFKVQHFKNWIEIWDYADRFYEFKYHKEATETVLGFYKTITDILPKTIGSFIKVLYYDLFIRRLPFHRKIVSSKWIILYYRKKLGYRLKRKLTIS